MSFYREPTEGEMKDIERILDSLMPLLRITIRTSLVTAVIVGHAQGVVDERASHTKE